ncbi:unnamed protein product [Allacma fusca]|uniref:G-protein coupled receptors family 1 profile domain-containing protein n=1 Tax=Allacma fusca TaxID=39272 RepID=A0A8J2KZX1_9HEXA|nr:unnamed protein product [Allacma fusca]
MCMTLILDYWETVSLTAGCNLYSTHFRLCVLTVRTAHQAGQDGTYKKDTNMYFRERDKPVVDAETFLATSIPKILISSLIIFLNVMAIAAICRSSNRSAWSGRTNKGYILPQSTQGLLHSLFIAYLCLGFLTLYSQISLSIFVLGEWRLFEDQGRECLGVNSIMIALSLAIALHLVSLAVDRTLASYLPYARYTSLSRGTVPLWLLSIWLPSIILGSLPMAGWRSNFSFCIFLHQFKDDYIRFSSGFYLTTVLLIPCLYIFFVIVLKPRKDPRMLYRWHRKLQAHHRLTFALILAINIICWTPFHCYLLMACLTCSYAYLASGFTLEYLYMLALVPSIIIPLMFSIGSNAGNKCANKISKCVHFLEHEETNKNPLANLKRSPLFFIDDAIQQHQRELKEKLSSDSSRQSSSRSKDKSFFAAPYLPDYASGEFQDSLPNKSKKRSEDNYEQIGSIRTAPLRNFCAYLNSQNKTENKSSPLSDRKYGFPVLPPSLQNHQNSSGQHRKHQV